MKNITKFIAVCLVFVSAGVYAQGKTGVLSKGYHAMADFGFGTYPTFNYNVSTTHGYQFNPYIFVGGGILAIATEDLEKCALPIFADFRINFLDKKVSPLVDFRNGITVSQGVGFYSQAAFGARFILSEKYAMNLYTGFELYELKSRYLNEGKNFYASDKIGSIIIKLGFEF